MDGRAKTTPRGSGELRQIGELTAALESEKLQKQKVEKALLESEEYFRNFIERSPVGIYRTTLSGEILFVNDALVRICEFDDQEDMKATNVLLRYKNPENREELLRILNAEGYVSNFDFEIVTKKGNTRNVLLSATLKGDQISGMMMDVTKRKYVEEQLRKSEAKFRSLINTAASVILALNPEGIITEFNAEAERVFGLKRSQALGMNYYERFLPREVRKSVKLDVEEVMAGKTTCGFENPIISADGSMRYFSWNVKCILDEASLPAGIIAVGQDITERKQNEESLSLLLDISQNIAMTIDINELIKIAVEKTIELRDLDRVCVVLVNEKGRGKVSAVAVKDQDAAYDPGELDFNRFKLMKRAMDDRKTIFLSVDSEVSPLNRAELGLLEKLEMGCFMAIPLLARSRVFGLIKFGFRDKNRSLSGRDKNFFETIANQLSAMIANAKNYEEAKNVGEALRLSEQNYRRIFNDSPVALWEENNETLKKHIDALKNRGINDFEDYFNKHAQDIQDLAARRTIVEVNPAALHLFGAGSKTELLKKRDKIFSGETYEALKKWLISAAQGRHEFDVETTVITIQGNTLDVYVKVFIAPEYEQTWKRVLISIMDVTERKKQEIESLKIQKLESIGMLAGGIAHDFNNLLTAILGNINLARIQPQPENMIFKRLEEAEKAALRAKDLTQQLLTFSTGGIPVKKAASIEQLIKDSVEFSLRGSNIKCNYFFASNLWLVEIDEGQIRQAINNIVLNADQAMPEGGSINCRAENCVIKDESLLPLKNGNYIKISIEDQGMGMPQEHLQKIFDPYFSTKQKESGLGLSAAYSIIARHNGYIKVDSEVGAGTTVTVYLPASNRDAASAESYREKLHFGTGRILLMDDEDMVREVAGIMLEQLGYEVTFASNGEEAIAVYLDRKALGNPFDAVIMDLTVPGSMGGREAVAKLLDQDPDARPIVSSGYSNDPIMANFMQYGFKSLIKKPFTMKELGDVLHEVLASDN